MDAMDDRDVRGYWNGNAETWTRLARAGYDVYRDGFNTPAFLAMLPDVAGARGLDLGCGEGHNTRLLAARGAVMTAVDLSEAFLRDARVANAGIPAPIAYVHASAASLPFRDASFDFATAFMSLMDMPDVERVIAETARVLRPGGFLQASIEHPCFLTPHRRKVKDAEGRTVAIEVAGYFQRRDGEVSEWTFGQAPPEIRAAVRPFRIPQFTRTLSEWLMLFLGAGWRLEQVQEPRPDADTVRRIPRLHDATLVATFLHLRLRRPA
ncbi:methyltransferase [Luteitalea sp. TBR-22]|uniref:class I SAM-dependent methyltransferase n=1 Tax=Luteitalea sp. TBR-22 TaxID=2802971 RepID=UPI001AF8528F|nr:class I SAM-dependent methyltransferase [Luteitalea sp. TBR-22]BCS32256.1 methyltransferase [Luteitalea sp. TBR-22]